MAELSNSTLTNILGYQADDADLTLTVDRAALEMVMMGQKRLSTLIEEGTADAEGDVGLLEQLGASMVTFTPDFPMVPGTTEPPVDHEEWNPFEASVPYVRGE